MKPARLRQLPARLRPKWRGSAAATASYRTSSPGRPAWRSDRLLNRHDPSVESVGFSPESVTAMRVHGMGSGPVFGMTYQQFLDRIAEVPGMGAAAVSSAAVSGPPGTPFEIVGRPDVESVGARQSASYQIVSAEYFAVLGIPLRAGRTFAPTDSPRWPS